MYSQLSVVALCAAVSIKEASAGHVHRHLHPKREIAWAATETVMITDYVTVTVTEDEEPTTAAVGASNTVAAAAVADPATTSSSSAVVLTTTTSPSVAPAPAPSTTEVEQYTPVASPTTMVTSVKTSAAAPAAETPAVTSSAETSSADILSITNILLPSTTSSYSAAPASTSAATSSSTGKRGAAYNDASLVSELLNMGGDISWAYNWGSDSSGLLDTIKYYPMLWSPASEHSSDWDEKASAAISSGSDCLLSFNEPDIAAQANLGAADAAAGHIKFMNPYAGKARISSPAISSSQNANQGIDWLTQFFTACNGECQVDFCSAHWYGPGGADGAEEFLQHLTDVHNACENKNVWATEFAAESGDVDEFMKTVVEKLDTDEYSFVEKYSYFMVTEGSLLESATSLSSFGKIFAGLA